MTNPALSWELLHFNLTGSASGGPQSWSWYVTDYIVFCFFNIFRISEVFLFPEHKCTRGYRLYTKILKPLYPILNMSVTNINKLTSLTFLNN